MSKTLIITIQCSLGIGLVGCKRTDDIEVEVAADHYEGMSNSEREEWVHDRVRQWAFENIDFWGDIIAEEEG